MAIIGRTEANINGLFFCISLSTLPIRGKGHNRSLTTAEDPVKAKLKTSP
jgi:hypothetical protein